MKVLDKIALNGYNEYRKSHPMTVSSQKDYEINRLSLGTGRRLFLYYRFLSINIAIIVANTKTKANISLYVTNIQ